MDHEQTEKKDNIITDLSKTGFEPGSSEPQAVILTAIPCHFPLCGLSLIKQDKWELQLWCQYEESILATDMNRRIPLKYICVVTIHRGLLFQILSTSTPTSNLAFLEL